MDDLIRDVPETFFWTQYVSQCNLASCAIGDLEYLKLQVILCLDGDPF
jgi:hypothetical protein